MVSSYVLVSTKNLYAHRVASEILNLDEVINVKPLNVDETNFAEPFFEDYNLIVKINPRSDINIKKFVKKKIKNLSGIQNIRIISKSAI